MRISKERKIILAQYARAAAGIYGVISVADFVDFFNHYDEFNTGATDLIEAKLALKRHLQESSIKKSGYRLVADFIVLDEFYKSYQPDYVLGKIEEVFELQTGKPRMMPEIADLDLIVEGDPTWAPLYGFKPLSDYIRKKELLDLQEGKFSFDERLSVIIEIIHRETKIGDEFIQAFSMLRYWLKEDVDRRTFKHLIKLAVNAYETTPRYIDNGYSINDLREIYNDENYKKIEITDELLEEMKIPYGNYDYEDMSDEAIEIGVRQIIDIVKYAHSAVNLYGVITISDFVEFYNRYESVLIDEEDVTEGLKMFTSIMNLGDYDFVLFDDLLVHEFISPEYDEPGEDYFHNQILIAQQMADGRYYPPANKVIDYGVALNLEPKIHFDRLKAIIMNYKLFKPVRLEEAGSGVTTLDLVMYQLSCLARCGLDSDMYAHVLQNDFKIEMNRLSVNAKEQLEDIFIDIFNDIRMFSNNGFSLNELEPVTNAMSQSFANVLRQDNPKPMITEKIGRNEPCPCGSGKKYKKCCLDTGHLRLLPKQ